jgi:hypothetical protein
MTTTSNSRNASVQNSRSPVPQAVHRRRRTIRGFALACAVGLFVGDPSVGFAHDQKAAADPSHLHAASRLAGRSRVLSFTRQRLLARAPAASPQPAERPLSLGPRRPADYALVVGIERYRSEPAAAAARGDATTFADLARTTLGLSADHVRQALDDRATKADIETEIAWLANSVGKGGRVYLYFAGHGVPDPSDGRPYLLPYDGSRVTVSTSGLGIADVLERLAQSEAEEVLVFVDACYAGRSLAWPGLRGLELDDGEPVAPSTPTRVALFTAATGSGLSATGTSGKSGLFTQYLVRGLGQGEADRDADGEITMDELDQWVTPQVQRDAKQDHGRTQVPRLRLSEGTRAEQIIVATGLPERSSGTELRGRR